MSVSNGLLSEKNQNNVIRSSTSNRLGTLKLQILRRGKILSSFESNIWKEREINHARPHATNISKHQFNILNHLRSNTEIIIIQCDKNLGPGVMQPETYICGVLQQHL